MCTLAAYVRVSADLPLVVAANRDEFLDRPATEPAVLAYDPWVVAGQDLTAGGTWFGVNQHGMVVGLLNRRRAGGPDVSLRSRGLLCLEVLQTTSPTAAADLLRTTTGQDYNSFNLLVADAYDAYVAGNADGPLRITRLDPGVHLLTNLELNDPTCPRIAKSSQLFAGVRLVSTPAGFEHQVIPPLRTILSDHTTTLDPRGPIIETLCVHLPGYGTRSSSLVAVTSDRSLRYWHAPGPPCLTPYAEVALPSVEPR